MEHLLKTNFTKELGTKVVIDSIFSLERLQILESYLSERDANHFSDVLVNKDLYPEGADAFKTLSKVVSNATERVLKRLILSREKEVSF